MSQYRYRALDTDGTLLRGQLETHTREAAISHLQGQGLTLLMVEDTQSIYSPHGWRRRSSVSRSELTRVTQQLATLMNAGQPLERALSILLRQPGPAGSNQLLARILDRVKTGLPLSTAMAQEPDQFSSLYLSLVTAGEASGALGETLAQLATYLERVQIVRGEVINALIYPAFLVAGVLCSLVLLLTYVVPQFVPVFEGLGVPIPWLTQIVLDIGFYLGSYGIYLLSTVIVIGFWLFHRLRQPAWRLWMDSRLLKLKVLGPLYQRLETARLTRTLGTLLTQGVPLLRALTISQGVCGNHAIRAALIAACAEVKEGGVLSGTLAAHNVLPDLALQMIHVGEESGQLNPMLLQVADVFDREARRSIDALLAALVPTLTLIMTALVATIMLAIMLPLMSLTSNL